MDAAEGSNDHVESVSEQVRKLEDSSLTPSARMLTSISGSFQDFAMGLAEDHRDSLCTTPLTPERHAHYEQVAADSLAAKAAIEAEEQVDFDIYLAQRQKAYENLLRRL